MKKKNIIIIVIIVVLVILLFPIPNRLKDGGTVEYKALLYTITDYKKIALEGGKTEYLEGIKIEILGFEIFNSLEKKEETTPTNNEERIKLKDLKIKAEDIDITKLVKFNNVLYGKSNGIIDYAGDINKSIGKIDLLIGEEYLPQLDRETNCKEFLNCSVLEANGQAMVLNVDNVAVLFRAINKENIKKFDNLGRIVIQKEIRKNLGWIEDDEIIVWDCGNAFILQKLRKECVFCKRNNNLMEFKTELICEECKNELKEI